MRLALTAGACALIGADRGEHGRPAGLRTTLLAGLAAAIAMIQANLLLPVAGKASDSYVVMDLMRLPLGILSGMGFIGAGAILRRDNVVLGVTTAATLWFVTVMGLCFGGGQLGLGIVACLLGFLVLRALKPVEESWSQDRRATLIVTASSDGPGEKEIAQVAGLAGYRIKSLSILIERVEGFREIKCEIKWRARADEVQPPAFVEELERRPGTLKVSWQG